MQQDSVNSQFSFSSVCLLSTDKKEIHMEYKKEAAEDAPPCPADLNPMMMMFITVFAGD